ncbi:MULTISPECIES: hypothetical protein [unclassified Polaribacter]|uniref:hypothetical protein n=1 Tax=unclassified Polaribacter TaxID=196858 RepID=UPI0011BF65C5|nr:MULTISPECIES: hypothetical protein [unclassified Polaribacter]TXD52646.1 hypothetical protein ES043_07340 [Polaribacter sp. IC063]TXD60615.1 hypothetical protein ES044_06875 [Polaribacter sp. IC066]
MDIKVLFSESNKKRVITVLINDDAPIISHEFTPPNYKTSELNEFVGDYFSPKLNTTYKTVIKNDTLTFTHARASNYAISAAKNELFLSNSGSFLFKRDANQQITGFRFSAGRVQNLWFKKLKKLTTHNNLYNL